MFMQSHSQVEQIQHLTACAQKVMMLWKIQDTAEHMQTALWRAVKRGLRHINDPERMLKGKVMAAKQRPVLALTSKM